MFVVVYSSFVVALIRCEGLCCVLVFVVWLLVYFLVSNHLAEEERELVALL